MIQSRIMNFLTKLAVCAILLWKTVGAQVTIPAVKPAKIGSTVRLTCTISSFSLPASWTNNDNGVSLTTCFNTGSCSPANDGVRYSFSADSSSIIATITGFSLVDRFTWKCEHNGIVATYSITVETETTTGLSTGAIVGIVIACVVAVAVHGILIYLIIKYCCNKCPGLSTGAIVGIVIACVVVCAVEVGLIYLIIKYGCNKSPGNERKPDGKGHNDKDSRNSDGDTGIKERPLAIHTRTQNKVQPQTTKLPPLQDTKVTLNEKGDLKEPKKKKKKKKKEQQDVGKTGEEKRKRMSSEGQAVSEEEEKVV